MSERNEQGEAITLDAHRLHGLTIEQAVGVLDHLAERAPLVVLQRVVVAHREAAEALVKALGSELEELEEVASRPAGKALDLAPLVEALRGLTVNATLDVHAVAAAVRAVLPSGSVTEATRDDEGRITSTRTEWVR